MAEKTIKILFVGDIVGRPGRRAVEFFVPKIKTEKAVDLVIANGENATSGYGMTREKYDELIRMGIDYFTSGNHIWDKTEFLLELDKPDIKVIRPMNYSYGTPGRGATEILVNGHLVVLANLIGRVFMKDEVEDPFKRANELAEKYSGKIIIIDFHAEATSEKVALGHYLDGRISALIGTHTHVQTADEMILPHGTAYISDAGMCGPIDSVIGVKKEIIIEKFLTQLPKSHKVASGDSIFSAVLIEIDPSTQKATSIERISHRLKA